VTVFIKIVVETVSAGTFSGMNRTVEPNMDKNKNYNIPIL